jgi:hypothetical protein
LPILTPGPSEVLIKNAIVSDIKDFFVFSSTIEKDLH